MGLQFHPEVTAVIIDRWISELAHRLDAADVAKRDLRSMSATRLGPARRNAHRIFDRFLRLAQVS
jgi:hypothetical protein